MKALVLLQLRSEQEGPAKAKTELLLHHAGFNANEIGDLLGKNPGSVAKAIQRARQAREKKGGEDE